MQQLNLISLYVFIVITSLVQLFINNSTFLYLDLLSILIVIILTVNIYTIPLIVLLALLADLIGHWYLGMHLIAAIVLSGITKYSAKFYYLSGFLQQVIIVMLFFTCFNSIMVVLGLICKNLHFSWLNFIIELAVIAVPLGVFKSFIILRQSDSVIN